jgi:hypothetical protein
LPKEEKGIKIMKITPGWQQQNMRNLLWLAAAEYEELIIYASDAHVMPAVVTN